MGLAQARPNNAHDLSAEYILILIIHYEIALLSIAMISLNELQRVSCGEVAEAAVACKSE